MQSRGVAISVLVHAAAIAAAIIVPLVASDQLPPIHNALAPYVRAFRPADIPLLTPTVERSPLRRSGAPTVAPSGISPEALVPPVTDGPTVPFGTEDLVSTGVPGILGTEAIAPLPPPPPPPPPPAPAVVKPVPVGGRIRTPARLAYATPVYPPLAISARVEGDVVLEAIIGVDGSVQNLRVVRGVQLLDGAALDAVRRWRYTPTLLNGVPVPVVMTVTVSFRLSK